MPETGCLEDFVNKTARHSLTCIGMQLLRTHQRDSEAVSAIKRGVLRPRVEKCPGRVSEGRVRDVMVNHRCDFG